MASDNYQKAHNLYLKGCELFRKRNITKALKLITKAADYGYDSAMYFLAHLYKTGRTVDFIEGPKDPEKAFYWMKKRAECGYASAAYECATMDPDKNNWLYWMEKAAKKGLIEAAYELACYYKDPDEEGHRDLEKAFHLFGTGAEKKDRKCEYEYAQMYRNGAGTTKNLQSAFDWMEKAARDAGWLFPDPQYEYAKMLYQGEGCARNLEKAWHEMETVAKQYKFKDSEELSEKYLEELAESGNARACYKLGRCYEEGEGFEQDYAKAAYFYEKVSTAVYSDPDITDVIMDPVLYGLFFKDRDLGYENQAMLRLANLYYEGKGVSRDHYKAFYWSEVAARLGNKDARNMAEKVRQEIWDLKEENVDRIFKECIDNENMGDDLCVDYELFEQKNQKGDQGKAHINLVKQHVYASIIQYMCGQLKAFHSSIGQVMSFDDGMTDYQNNVWTNDEDTLIKFYALGIANEYISKFFILRDRTLVAKRNPGIIPTYFTGDPGYPEWYENEYKSENRSIDDFFTVFGTVYAKHDVSYKRLKSVLSHFWNQPPESRVRIMDQIKEKVSEASSIPEERKKEFFDKSVGKMLEIAEAHDSVFYMASRYPDSFPENYLNGIFYDLPSVLQEKVTDMKNQGADYTAILYKVEKTVEYLVSEEILEIAGEAFGVAEE
ncbi:MAG: sel1 repeat family protein [Parasporobacterium sp.]|nr:sel1 repeat family protein [Parasporobacterium sp.]